MWSGAWNKAHFRNLLPNRFLASTVGREWDWWSGGCGFNPRWGQFFILLFSFNAGRILPRFGRKFLIMQKHEWETYLICAAKFFEEWYKFTEEAVFISSYPRKYKLVCGYNFCSISVLCTWSKWKYQGVKNFTLVARQDYCTLTVHGSHTLI